MRFWGICFLGIVSVLKIDALEVQPWFSDVYEFHLFSGYSFSWFRSVNGAVTPLKDTFYDHLIFSDLEFSISPQWNLDANVELTQSSKRSFGFRSVAVQGRYLWFDDIIGDAVSLATGANIRYIFPQSVRDISCPYGANVDLEVNLAMGKEFSSYSSDFRIRFWGYGALGVANRGAPWLKGIFAFETNSKDLHKWAFFLEGVQGFGSKNVVNINNFHGYAQIHRTSLDVGIRYGYAIGVLGTLRLEYRRRVIAELCPERVDTIQIGFMLPFSF